ncbi:hypothetical protein MHYP_G00256630 [Metynnis hypsauchen]
MEQQEWARLMLGALRSPPATWLRSCCFSKETGSGRSIWLVPLHRLSFQPHSDHTRTQARGTGGWEGAWMTEHNALFLHKPVPNTPPKHPTLQAMRKKCQKPAASEFSHKEGFAPCNPSSIRLTINNNGGRTNRGSVPRERRALGQYPC